MRSRKLVLLVSVIALVICCMFLGPNSPNRMAHAQQGPPLAVDDAGVIHAETRLVLVDTVVTDKKGNYIRDLAQKDFKVWEDGKEQPVTSFSYEESTGSADAKPRYMVLLFDNSTMEFGDQAKARDAATRFIAANAAPDRLIAIAEFGGSVRITQNFTADATRLKQVVAGLKGSAVSPNSQPSTLLASLATPPTAPSLNSMESDFGIHTVLLALRSLAKGMSSVPGRKTLVMLTAGFPLSFESQSELTAVIDTCNKSNVAIYPIDVRGLLAPQLTGPQSRLAPHFDSSSASLTPAAYHLLAGTPMLSLASFAESEPF